jgi:hypothetical protein
MKTKIAILIGVTTLFFVAGCGDPWTSPSPNRLTEGYNPSQFDKITIVPVLDMRPDKKKTLNLDAWVIPGAETHLKKKGYAVSIISDRSIIQSLQDVPTKDVLDIMVKDFNISDGSRWIMIFGLLDSYSKLTFGSTGNAEMIAYLIDQENKQIVWKNYALGQIGQGGLIGMTMKGAMEQSAVAMAAQQLLYNLPKKEKNKVN